MRAHRDSRRRTVSAAVLCSVILNRRKWGMQCSDLFVTQSCLILWACVIYYLWVMKMLIHMVIKQEAERNEKMIRDYEALLAKLPRGSLICRKNGYYYLKFRENGKVCDKYIGKNDELVSDLRSKLELRSHYSVMLSALKQEQRAIHKIWEGLA